MRDLTKATKRKLRELVGLAYQRALARELVKLEGEFARWRATEIDVFELSERIHQFHNGAAQDLYCRFVRTGLEQWQVARAIVDGHITEAEAGPDVLAVVERELRDERISAAPVAARSSRGRRGSAP